MSDYLFDYLLISGIRKTLENQGFPRAADGNRTRDLRTTNATLYRLSHSSLQCIISHHRTVLYHSINCFVNGNWKFYQIAVIMENISV